MRIAVLGAGAMGGLYGSWLSRENDVLATVDVRDCVYDVLVKAGFPEMAKQYRDYRK